MHRIRRRRRETGISLLDVTVATFVVSISLVGLVSTVVYQRSLERQTTRLWDATATATATLEDMRADSRDKWSSLTTDWEGHSVTTNTRASIPTERRLTSTVNDLASLSAVIEGLDISDEERLEYEANLEAVKVWAAEQELSADTEIHLVTQMKEYLESQPGTLDQNFGVTNFDTLEAEIKDAKHALVVSVSDDESGLDDGAEMWSSGATTPNFYHVYVAFTSDDNEFANALRFETYVADRSGLDDDSVAGSSMSNSDGVTEIEIAEGVTQSVLLSFDSSADAISANPTIQLSGADKDVLTLSWENLSSTNLDVKKVQFWYYDTGEATTMTFAGTEFYNGDSDNWIDETPPSGFAGIPPGAFDLVVTGNDGGGSHATTAFEGQRIWIKIEFEDGSRTQGDIQL